MRALCGAYATVAGEKAGVWGGKDTERAGRPAGRRRKGGRSVTSYRWRVFGVAPGSPPGAEPTDQGYVTREPQHGSEVWILTSQTGGSRILEGLADVDWLNAQSLQVEEYE